MDQLIWVVCLDRSGSMEEGFSAYTANADIFRGRTEETKQRIKLDAAKEAILNEVQGLDATSNIAILAFDDETKLIYSGTAGKINRIKEALSAVTPGGRTNIARCLLKCAEFADDYRRVDCLVVTDGLSNVGDPLAAARECNQRGIFINIALIDQTPDGERIAREIARGGRVYVIKSAPELDIDLGLEGIRHQLKKERQDRISVQQSMEILLSEFHTNTSEMRKQLMNVDGMIKESQYDIESKLSHLEQSSKHIWGRLDELQSDVRPLLQSFSLGIPVDQAPLHRYVPIRVYLKEGSSRSIKVISWTVDRVIENISFVVADDIPEEKGSFWKRWTAKSKEVLTYPEIQERLAKIEQAFELKTLDGPMAKIDRDLAGAVAELIKAVENEPEAALQVGTILILKTRGADGNSRLMVRTLSPKQLAVLERYPESLKEPGGVLDLLASNPS